MDFKLMGSILLVVGTSIGAGMLALPVATASLGFFGSSALLLICWAVMTIGALLILEVNLWLPQNSNLISMAKTTIGPVGKYIAIIVYLLLLYSLLSAYIAGGGDLFQHLFLAEHINISSGLSALIFTFLFGFVVFLGIKCVDYVNRLFMFIKLGAFLLLILFLFPHLSFNQLFINEITSVNLSTAVMVTITSFGFATIVPSLRIYFNSDVNKLKKAIIIGSLIPLICYLIWDAAIMGIIPTNGENSLFSILQSKTSASDLVSILSLRANTDAVTWFSKIFTSICVITSFLGVALCLTDFLADGLKREKEGLANVGLILLTLAPPFFIVLFFPGVFITALKYAGLLCVILLLLLPTWMAWRGRYQHGLSHSFKVIGEKSLLMVILGVSFLLILNSMI